MTNKVRYPLTVNDDQETGYCSTYLSTRISVQFSIIVPLLSCRSSNNNYIKNGLMCKKTGEMKIQETSFKWTSLVIRQGTHWQIFQAKLQSTKQQVQGKQQTSSSMNRCSDGDVANCDSQIDCWEINIRDAIARKLSSKMPIDSPGCQSTPKHIKLLSANRKYHVC